MAKKPKIEKLPDVDLPEMQLSDKQKKELDAAWEEVMREARGVVEDYSKNPSELSGSVIQIHEDSPFIDENVEMEKWGNVIKGNANDMITFGPEKPKKDVDKKEKK